jgi:serine O-acetyltransferase
MSLIDDYLAISKHTNSKIKPWTKIMFFSCILFRISNVLYKIKLVPFARIFWLVNRILFSIDIDPRANLKGGMVILHGAGIVIGKSVIAKGDFKIYQGATLGGNNGKKRILNDFEFSQPIIAHNVTIGINAAVLGPVLLEEEVIVGTNAIVTKDVASNKIVLSNNLIVNKKS